MKLKKNVTNRGHDKHITTQEFNKLIYQANLSNKSDIVNFVKKNRF